MHAFYVRAISRGVWKGMGNEAPAEPVAILDVGDGGVPLYHGRNRPRA
jgi:hypothetical protein